MYSNIDESRIKRKVIDIVRTFRSFGFLSDSDVTIHELEEKNKLYIVSGEYSYRQMFTEVNKLEKGSFIISLDSNLVPKKVKIIPS